MNDNKDINNNYDINNQLNEGQNNNYINNTSFNNMIHIVNNNNIDNTEIVLNKTEIPISGVNDDININNDNNVNINFNNDVVIPKEIVIDTINNNDIDNTINSNNHGNSNKNKEEYVYDDGIDTDDIDDKFSIKKFFTSRKFLLILSIFIFIFAVIVVGKAFYYGDKIDEYEEFFTVIESKDEDKVVVSNDDMNKDEIKGDAASELINCINSSIDINNIPDSINNVINDINNYYNQSNNYFSFVYKDLFTGFMVSYNANQSIFAASTIKAPKDIYLWEMASLGKVNLDDELTYTSGYCNTGTGVLKNKKTNTKYSVRTLLEYSTVTSDNAAHNMLMDKYGKDNMLNFWKEKGTNTIFTSYGNWGLINGHDAVIYMEELYKFYINDSEYGGSVMNNFINSYPKFLKGKNNYKIASKSGWSGSSLHDVSIIFADNPYIVVALSNLGDTGYYTSYFNTVNDLAYRLHTEYWKYKMNICNNILQYNE